MDTYVASGVVPRWASLDTQHVLAVVLLQGGAYLVTLYSQLHSVHVTAHGALGTAGGNIISLEYFVCILNYRRSIVSYNVTTV